MENNEQWLLEGKCQLCRRANYCNKNCKARNKHVNDIIQKAFEDTMEKNNPGYKELMEKIRLN